MKWFAHRHFWRPKTDLNTIRDPSVDKIVGGLILEDCACGAVRTIEFRPGENPIVRIATTPISGDR